MKKAGFEILETKDFGMSGPEYEIPWYDSLEGKYWSATGFAHTPIGMWLTNKMVWFMETVHIAPKGTLEIHSLLLQVAHQLVQAGKLEIFSPSYFYLARKPKK